MSAEKTVIHNPHPGTNTKVSKNKLKAKQIIKNARCSKLFLSVTGNFKSSEVMD